MKMKIFVVGASIALLALISGCIQKEEVGIKTSLTEIRIGDMPTEEFSHINVTFSEIKLHRANGNDSGWIVISTEPKTVDLIYLHINNLTEQLGIKEIEIGNYTKLWIVVENATGVLKETGETITFDVPSGDLKIQHLFDLREGNNTITVDIDLNNSVLAVHGKVYKLLPVISGLNVEYANGSRIRVCNPDRLKNMTENRKPVIDIVVNGNRDRHVTVNINESIMFNASGTFDIDNDTITYTWDFGDGTNGSGAVVTHSYSEKGTYHVTLIASDGKLESTVTITVTAKQISGHDGKDF